jgi:hypothetical protein
MKRGKGKRGRGKRVKLEKEKKEDHIGIEPMSFTLQASALPLC